MNKRVIEQLINHNIYQYNNKSDRYNQRGYLIRHPIYLNIKDNFDCNQQKIQNQSIESISPLLKKHSNINKQIPKSCVQFNHKQSEIKLKNLKDQSQNFIKNSIHHIVTQKNYRYSGKDHNLINNLLNITQQSLVPISSIRTSRNSQFELDNEFCHKRSLNHHNLFAKRIKDIKLPILHQKKLPEKINIPGNIPVNSSISPKITQENIQNIEKKKGYLIYQPSIYQYFHQNKDNFAIKQKVNTILNQKTIKILKQLSARKFCVLNTSNLELVLNNNYNQQFIEIASLTKIVTALLTILVCQKFNIDIRTYTFRINEQASMMPGTSANLKAGDVLTIQELLYGLMLPSGNDAAVTLAQVIGKIIIKNKTKICKLTPLKIFVNHMNKLYKQILDENQLQQKSSHIFQNPSGLITNPNVTTPQKILLLSAIAIKHPLFKKIVCTKQYILTVKNQRYGLLRNLSWKNTNKLLWKQWEGIKTGNTQNAGQCFIGKFQNYLIGVFDCETSNKRFQQAQIILQNLIAYS